MWLNSLSVTVIRTHHVLSRSLSFVRSDKLGQYCFVDVVRVSRLGSLKLGVRPSGLHWTSSVDITIVTHVGPSLRVAFDVGLSRWCGSESTSAHLSTAIDPSHVTLRAVMVIRRRITLTFVNVRNRMRSVASAQRNEPGVNAPLEIASTVRFAPRGLRVV